MLTIGKIRYIETANTARIESKIKTEGEPDFLLFIEVEKEWAKYLVTDRADAFLVGILHKAMLNKHDITCEDPVSAELKIMLERQLIHTLAKYDKKIYPVKIIANLINKPLKNIGATGTGLSMGLDSFTTIAENYNAESNNTKLTHLLTFVQTFAGIYGKANRDYCAQRLYEKEKQVAKELKLPLIALNTNLDQFMCPWATTWLTFALIMAAMSLGKLFKAYYLSSVGLDFSHFDICNRGLSDCETYDLLTINCCSIEGGIRFLSGGGEKDRMEKFQVISKFPIAKKYLHSCPYQHYNCMICPKCRRNLVCLDALDMLDDFSSVYDIPYYRANRENYIEWMCQQIQMDNHASKYIEPAYNLLRKKEPQLIEKYTYPISKLINRMNEFKRQRDVYREYAKFYRQILTKANWQDKLKVWFQQRNIKEVILYGNDSGTQLLIGIADQLGIKIPYVVEDLPTGGV